MKLFPIQQNRRRHLLVSMAIASAFLLAACSSASSSSSSTSATTSAPASASSSSAASSLGPIKIGLGSTVIPGVYDAQTQYLAGIKAAEGYINANGGWGGRTVQLVQCSSPGDPASDLKCYHSIIGGQSVTMMGLLQNSANYVPL